MRLKTVLRTTGVTWAVPPLFYLVWDISITQSYTPAYWGSNTAVVGFALFLIAPTIAACSAWEAGKLRNGKIFQLALVRSPYAIAVQALIPAMILGLGAIVVSLAAVRYHVGSAQDLPDWRVVAFALAMCFFHAAPGYAAGLVLPRLLAPPLVLVIDYLWMVMPQTSHTNMWLRHLTGHLDTGLALTDQVNPTALVAPVLLGVGITLGIVVASEAIRLRRTRTAAVGSLACFLVFAVAAYLPVADWDADPPAYARSDSPVCQGSHPRICVPTELASDLPRYRKAAKEVIPRLAAAGLVEPDRLATVSTATTIDAGTWRLNVGLAMSEQDLEAQMASSAMPLLPICDPYDDTYKADPLPLNAWLMLTGGVLAETAAGHAGQQAVGMVQKEILTRSQRAQAVWFNHNIDLLQRCKPAPETLVG